MAAITCLTGFIARAPLTSQFLTGTHVLRDAVGNTIVSLRSDTVNLVPLEGRFALVCGSLDVIQSAIHGTQLVVTVTSAVPLPVDFQRLALLLSAMVSVGVR